MKRVGTWVRIAFLGLLMAGNSATAAVISEFRMREGVAPSAPEATGYEFLSEVVLGTPPIQMTPLVYQGIVTPILLVYKLGGLVQVDISANPPVIANSIPVSVSAPTAARMALSSDGTHGLIYGRSGGFDAVFKFTISPFEVEASPLWTMEGTAISSAIDVDRKLVFVTRSNGTAVLVRLDDTGPVALSSLNLAPSRIDAYQSEFSADARSVFTFDSNVKGLIKVLTNDGKGPLSVAWETPPGDSFPYARPFGWNATTQLISAASSLPAAGAGVHGTLIPGSAPIVPVPTSLSHASTATGPLGWSGTTVYSSYVGGNFSSGRPGTVTINRLPSSPSPDSLPPWPSFLPLFDDAKNRFPDYQYFFQSLANNVAGDRLFLATKRAMSSSLLTALRRTNVFTNLPRGVRFAAAQLPSGEDLRYARAYTTRAGQAFQLYLYKVNSTTDVAELVWASPSLTSVEKGWVGAPMNIPNATLSGSDFALTWIATAASPFVAASQFDNSSARSGEIGYSGASTYFVNGGAHAWSLELLTSSEATPTPTPTPTATPTATPTPTLIPLGKQEVASGPFAYPELTPLTLKATPDISIPSAEAFAASADGSSFITFKEGNLLRFAEDGSTYTEATRIALAPATTTGVLALKPDGSGGMLAYLDDSDGYALQFSIDAKGNLAATKPVLFGANITSLRAMPDGETVFAIDDCFTILRIDVSPGLATPAIAFVGTGAFTPLPPNGTEAFLDSTTLSKFGGINGTESFGLIWSSPAPSFSIDAMTQRAYHFENSTVTGDAHEVLALDGSGSVRDIPPAPFKISTRDFPEVGSATLFTNPSTKDLFLIPNPPRFLRIESLPGSGKATTDAALKFALPYLFPLPNNDGRDGIKSAAWSGDGSHLFLLDYSGNTKGSVAVLTPGDKMQGGIHGVMLLKSLLPADFAIAKLRLHTRRGGVPLRLAIYAMEANPLYPFTFDEGALLWSSGPLVSVENGAVEAPVTIASYPREYVYLALAWESPEALPFVEAGQLGSERLNEGYPYKVSFAVPGEFGDTAPASIKSERTGDFGWPFEIITLDPNGQVGWTFE